MKRAVLTALLSLATALPAAGAVSHYMIDSPPEEIPYRPVVTPNGSTLPWTWDGDVKVFHLVAEPVTREFAPGFVINCLGYNGQTPGPTIEAVEGDRIRILVTNRLPENTSLHPHGVLLPNGMDGVSGLTQHSIPPGATYAYEWTVRQHGTQMYHPHLDEMTQISLGMHGFLIFHPREREAVDRDYAIFLNEWHIPVGAHTPDPSVMTDFNTFTFNSRVFPGTAPLDAQTGERVRIRFANLSMDSHPIHLHGYQFRITGTDGGDIPPSAQWPETTVNVPVGSTRTVEFVADAPGDWALHCHKIHHAMGQMEHGLPIVLGLDPAGFDERLRALLPGTMTMGQTGMGHMHDMGAPENTNPMMRGGQGPFERIEMGGMFTFLRVRERLEPGVDPGWYQHPRGTVAYPVDAQGRRLSYPEDEMTGHHIANWASAEENLARMREIWLPGSAETGDPAGLTR